MTLKGHGKARHSHRPRKVYTEVPLGWSGNARLNARRDTNERIIIEALEARGYHVDQINGKGIPDLLVSKHGEMWLIEVKRVKGKYNANQVQWRSRFQGPQPHCLRSVEEALRFPEGIQE